MMTVRVEMTYAEIARRLGVSTTSAKVLVRRALAKIGGPTLPAWTDAHKVTGHHCGICGELGHNRRRCPKRAAVRDRG